MSRRCRELRRQAVAGPLSARARAHMGGCADCAAFVRAADALAAALPQAIDAAPAPEELARGARRRVRLPRSRRPAAIACAVAAVALAAWAWPRPARPRGSAALATARPAGAAVAPTVGEPPAMDGIPAFVDSVVGGGDADFTGGWRRAEEPLAPYAYLAGVGDAATAPTGHRLELAAGAAPSGRRHARRGREAR